MTSITDTAKHYVELWGNRARRIEIEMSDSTSPTYERPARRAKIMAEVHRIINETESK